MNKKQQTTPNQNIKYFYIKQTANKKTNLFFLNHPIKKLLISFIPVRIDSFQIIGINRAINSSSFRILATALSIILNP